ncbi:MAG: hypothetical protein JWR66_4268 [Modestobacter sp.]|nr:hypothetical protein [Modestobacter sp.]
MRYYEATTSLEAGPEDVRRVLVDVAGWPARDSGVGGVDGGIAEGQRITMRSGAAPGRAFPVTVTDLDPARRLVPAGACRSVCSAACGRMR